MNDYIAVTFEVTPASDAFNDVLAALLCDIDFESFVPADDASSMIAYVRKEKFSEARIENVISSYPFDASITYRYETVEGQDWNSEWEKNYFKPIVVAGQCVVHSSFHTDVPQADYDIVIDPKMAFGTGHHATTSLMMGRILNTEIRGLNVVDMGTGSGILAILAAMRGAACVKAVEIDPMAYVNTLENVALNGVSSIVEVTEGDASCLPAAAWADIFLANINRNIIIQDIDRYAKAMKSGALLWLSGFYEDDVAVITDYATKSGLRYLDTVEMSGWVSASYIKE